MSGKPQKILLVEGKDDLFALSELFRAWDMPREFAVVDCKGVEALFRELRIVLGKGEQTHVGAIIDADRHGAARWRSLRDSLTAAGVVDLPEQPNPEGTIVTTRRKIRLGLWLMPDNRAEGMLEDFLRGLVPADDWMMPHAEAALDTLPDRAPRFKAIHRSKALVHTWLAWHEPPGQPLGLAMKQKLFDGEKAAAIALLFWLRSAFDLPGLAPLSA